MAGLALDQIGVWEHSGMTIKDRVKHVHRQLLAGRKRRGNNSLSVVDRSSTKLAVLRVTTSCCSGMQRLAGRGSRCSRCACRVWLYNRPTAPNFWKAGQGFKEFVLRGQFTATLEIRAALRAT